MLFLHKTKDGIIVGNKAFPRGEKQDLPPAQPAGNFLHCRAVVDALALIPDIELLDQALIIEDLIFLRYGLDDFFDILHGERLLIDKVGSVIGVANVAGCNMIRHAVAPLKFLADSGNIFIVYIHHHGYVIARSNIFIDILGNQLCGQVTGPPAHSVHRGIQDQRPFGLDLPQNLSVGKGKLQIVVPMKAQVDLRPHIFIDQVKAMRYLIAVHASQSIHNVKGIRLQLIHFLHQP